MADTKDHIDLSDGYHAEAKGPSHLLDVYTTLDLPEGMERLYVGSLAMKAVQAWATVAADALALKSSGPAKD